MTTSNSIQTHFHVLLDRSGSMQAISDDVIGGFNGFLAEQQADGQDARLTLVQFDSHDPAEIVVDAIPIREMSPLTNETFVPRGATPLLDATGRLIIRAQARAATLAAAAAPEEDVVIVTITDGAENRSCEFTRDAIRRMIGEREAAGWTFVYLSADLDAYADAGALGYDARSVQNFAADSAGAHLAFLSLSRPATNRRASNRAGRAVDKGDFFEGVKEAESPQRNP